METRVPITAYKSNDIRESLPELVANNSFFDFDKGLRLFLLKENLVQSKYELYPYNMGYCKEELPEEMFYRYLLALSFVKLNKPIYLHILINPFHTSVELEQLFQIHSSALAKSKTIIKDHNKIADLSSSVIKFREQRFQQIINDAMQRLKK